ncbi:hypothetical protein EW026_g1171 [Hermanssonia centrifuga]|uniref:Uncharacterized protein n=1 Tax=Hermanssonia centrifuga TaxID=98765 RepID=A0A4S4KSB3_9APHY|nr:hypothetical protein EW026_g1171 [Hermanssonia centrifuga]
MLRDHGTDETETLYLDHARLNTLRTDAADFTSLYMLLMLYRQLVHSSPRKDGSRTVVKQDELLALKKEIWEIGPAHLGHCFMRGTKSGDISETSEKAVEAAKWREDIGNVVLQLTMRASEVRSQPYIPTPSSSASTVSGKPPLTPDQNLLKLATSWTESNLRPESSLSVLMKKRVRCAVEDAVVEMILPPSFSRKTGVEAGASPSIEHATSGLEPLMPEIRHLAEKLKKLIHIHTTVYGALYAQPGFLVDQPPPVDPAA